MADVIFVAVIIAFFAVALALVKGCDRIIGPDLVLTDPADADALGGADDAATPEALAS